MKLGKDRDETTGMRQTQDEDKSETKRRQDGDMMETR